MEREPISVLLVDDEGFFISLIASQLRDEYGFSTTTAFSGKEAIELIQKARRSYDVILLDYMMPEVSGLNVIQWMHEQKNETPVVMLTAAGSEVVAVEAMKLGAYDYVRKEHIDLQRLAIVIQATNERHLFRVAKVVEEEHEREIKLNLEATEKVRRVLNTMTPALNGSFATISVELDLRANLILKSLPEELKADYEKLLAELRKNVATIEMGVKGLLGLYKVMYARYSEEKEIEQIRGEFEAKTADLEKNPR